MQLVLRPVISAVPKRDRPWNGLLRAWHRGDRIATLSMRVKSRTRYLSSAIEGWRIRAQAGMAGRNRNIACPAKGKEQDGTCPGVGHIESRGAAHKRQKNAPGEHL